LAEGKSTEGGGREREGEAREAIAGQRSMTYHSILVNTCRREDGVGAALAPSTMHPLIQSLWL